MKPPKRPENLLDWVAVIVAVIVGLLIAAFLVLLVIAEPALLFMFGTIAAGLGFTWACMRLWPP